MSPSGHGHGDLRHRNYDNEENTGEWMQLLRPSELREVLEYDRAQKEVERQIIFSNQAKLAGRSEAERRGRTPPVHHISGYGVGVARDDAMSSLYSKHVEASLFVKLLPRPGDGEKQDQLLWQKVVDFMMGFLAGPVFGVLTMLVTAGSVAIYLYETTLQEGDYGTGGGGWSMLGRGYPYWFSPAELFLLAFFGTELVLRAILADHHRFFWLSTETMVDVLSVLPSLLFVAFDLRLWGFLRFLRLFRWADISTIVDSRRRKMTNARGDQDAGASNEKAEGARTRRRGSFIASLKLLAFAARYVLVFAGCVTLLDRAEGGIEDMSESEPGEPIHFSTALYMAGMMLSTVGTGEYGPVPVSPGARVAIAVAVLVFLPLAAIRVADVVKHSGTEHSSVRAVSLAPSVRERHVVMCGSVNAANLQARLQEIFHADHGNHNVRWVRVVVLSPDPPSPRMATLLKHPRYRGRVTYIQGSPLHDDSLLNAHVEEAAAVMVLANKAPTSSHKEDMKLSLQAISVMTHVELDRRQGYGPRVLVEVVDPNAALHLQAAGIRQVVSSAQVKLSVLAQSCLCPGWSAIVANLLESREALPAQVLQQGSWLAEYYVGAKKTFYSVEFSPAFTGVLFAEAVVHIFEYFELILVAVDSKRHGHTNVDGDSNVQVNPAGDYRIRKGDRGFVLAESQADARVVWDYMAEDGKGGAIHEGTGRLKERFSSPEEEEALAMETLGTAGVVGLGPQAFVDSMVFSRTLLHCQKRLQHGKAPDSSLILGWAREFQSSDGVGDDALVRKVLASAGLEAPDDDHLVRDDPRDSSGTPVPTSQTATTRLFASSLAHQRKNQGRGPGARVAWREAGGAGSEAERAADAVVVTGGFMSKPTRKAGTRGRPGARERFLSDAVEDDDEDDDVEDYVAGGGRGGGERGGGGPNSSLAALTVVRMLPPRSETGDLLDMQHDGSPRLLAAATGTAGEEQGERADGGDCAEYDTDGDGGGGVDTGTTYSTAGTAGTFLTRAASSPGRTHSQQQGEAEEELVEEEQQQQQQQQQEEDGGRESSPSPRAGAAGDEVPDEDGRLSGEEILSTLRTMEVSSLTGDEARLRLLALCSASKATPPVPTPDAEVDAAAAAAAAAAGITTAIDTAPAIERQESLVGGISTIGGGASSCDRGRRRISSAKHLTGHVIILGFPARPSHLECFLRPLKGWTGGAGTHEGIGVAVVLVADDVSKLESALDVVDRNGFVNTSEVYLLQGSPVSQSDLENAGVRTANTILVMKDPRGTRFKENASGDPLHDAEALMSFMKMEDGLLTDNQHVVVEIENAANVRFLHHRAEARSLKAITSLGGAGAGGAADEAHYLWPKFAGGMTYNSSFVDSLFGQAFYRPSRIALIERLLLLDRGEHGQSGGMAPFSASKTKTASASAPSTQSPAASPGGDEDELDKGCFLRQMAVPPSFLGHSFGEMFQHLAAPPLRCVAFALLRARGTRNAPEPYVYTGPRADTVLHPGDRVFILGQPPVL